MIAFSGFTMSRQQPDGFSAWLGKVAVPVADGRYAIKARIGQVEAGTPLTEHTLRCIYRAVTGCGSFYGSMKVSPGAFSHVEKGERT